MTLPSSGTMTAAMINTELGRASNAPFSMNGAAERALAGVPAGGYSMASFYGKTAGGGGGGKQSAFIGTGSSSPGTSPSIPGVNFGAEAADRIIVLTVHWGFTGGTNRTLSSGTIGGVGFTIHNQQVQNGGASGQGVAIVKASVPTGTSGTVVLNFSGTSGPFIGVYRLSGGFGVNPTDIQVDTSETPTTNLSVNVTVPSAGCIIAGYVSSEIDSPNWSGVFENAEASADPSVTVSTASLYNVSGVIAVGVSITTDPTGGNQLIASAWG